MTADSSNLTGIHRSVVFVQLMHVCWMLIWRLHHCLDVCCVFEIQEVTRKKQKNCAESLHCVTVGSRGKERERKEGGGDQGYRERREGCVFTDLV